MYFIPGFFAGVFSAILQAINQGTLDNYTQRRDQTRTFVQQGGFQIIGILLTLAIGVFAGALIGLLFKAINKHNYSQQFNDNAIFSLDRKVVYQKYDDAVVSYD